MSVYETIVGLEIHSELKTKTKCFCACKNQFGSPVNTNVCPCCLGLPGALPTINKSAFEFAIKAGLAFDSEINNTAIFERKNYFYPDLPKAYQISQLEKNVCNGGKITYFYKGEEKSLGLFNIHLEEDAGKLIHDSETNSSLVDFNRSGVPLIEIVTKFDVMTPDEAVCILNAIRDTLMYIEVSDCKMQEGALRCDINVSVRKVGQTTYNERTEMKNVNSFKAVARAIEYEANRQIEILENGGKIIRQTLRWDDENGINYPMRSKEDANDYKYFPDPDLLEVVIDREYVEEIKKDLPMLPTKRKKYYMEELGLPQYDADVLTGKKEISDYFEECLKYYDNPKKVSNWVMSDIMRKLKDDLILEKIEVPVSAQNFTNLIKLVDNKELSQNASKEVLDEMWITNEPCEEIIEKLGLKQVNNADEIIDIVKQIIDDNPQAVSDYKNGYQKALTFFMGQVMKASRGKANPQIVNKLILEELSKR